MDYVATAEAAIAIGGAVVTTASAICAMTKTPDPTTAIGKFYRIIEILGVNVGRAKEKGLLPDNPVADAAGAAIVDVAKTVLGKTALALAIGVSIGGSLAACQQVQQAVIAFEQKAAPVVASACAKFRSAEANPLLQLAAAGGAMVANVETGGAAGPIIASLKSFGDNYCEAGPPAGDTTTAAQQADWLDEQITAQLLSAVGAKL